MTRERSRRYSGRRGGTASGKAASPSRAVREPERDVRGTATGGRQLLAVPGQDDTKPAKLPSVNGAVRAEQTTGLLLVRAAKLHRAAVSRHLARVGLHVGQDLLLLELEGSKGMPQRELADRLGVEQATVGVALRRLESAGFVQRRPASDDGRVRLVLLAPRGREVLPHVHAAWREAERVLANPLTASQLRELRALLGAVVRAQTSTPAD